MLYVGIGEICTQDYKTFLAKGRVIGAERETFPDKYPKHLTLQYGRLAEFFWEKRG